MFNLESPPFYLHCVMLSEQSFWTLIAALLASALTGYISFKQNSKQFEKYQAAELEKMTIQRKAEVLHRMIIALSMIESTVRKAMFTSTLAVTASMEYYTFKCFWHYKFTLAYGPFTHLAGETPETINLEIETKRLKLNAALKDHEFQNAELIQYMTEYSSYLDGDETLYSNIDELESFATNYYNFLEEVNAETVLSFWHNPDPSAPINYTNKGFIEVLDKVIKKVRLEVYNRTEQLTPFSDWKKLV